MPIELEETIKTFEDIAKKYYRMAEKTTDTLDMINLPGLEGKALDEFIVAESNKQVAEWLKELKAWRTFGLRVGEIIALYLPQEELKKLEQKISEAHKEDAK